MMTQPIYTFEHYRPAFPQSGDRVRVHRGTLEENRDSLNSSLVRARDFYALDDVAALAKATQAAETIPARFEGFADDGE